jgi:hypothetical protein
MLPEQWQGHLALIVSVLSAVITLTVLRLATWYEKKNLEQNHDDDH